MDERHLGTILTKYAHYHNTERPHRTLRLEPPRPSLALSHGCGGRGRCLGASTTPTRAPRRAAEVLPSHSYLARDLYRLLVGPRTPAAHD